MLKRKNQRQKLKQPLSPLVWLVTLLSKGIGRTSMHFTLDLTGFPSPTSTTSKEIEDLAD